MSADALARAGALPLLAGASVSLGPPAPAGSGGDASGARTCPRVPDATERIRDFLLSP